ncbi:hypothetical protein conserved [Leishmania donovani]|uniref:Uncharacterized protein n=2 Tax=Leishmania donovani TaxID=5661 RepID=A0A504Y3I2_LEIDO|nr:hypothetical protein CGC20_10435 [Leishmania donovani]CAJ1992189.1 hypothetical protein conserved [Leishmania donovani]
MSSARVSPLDSSSDCSTAHILISRSRSDEAGDINSNAFGAARQSIVSLPPTANSAMTLPASEAFASARSELTATDGLPSARYVPTPSTGRGRVPDIQNGTSHSVRVPSTLPTPLLMTNMRTPTAAQAPLWVTDEPKVRLPNEFTSASQASAAGPVESSLFGLPAAQSVMPRQSASLPVVPTSRGAGSEWRRGTVSVNGTSGSHVLPPLPPPVRPPSMCSVVGSKAGSGAASQRPSTSARGSKASVLDGSTLDGTDTAAQPLAKLTTTPDGENSWWAAVRKFVSNHREQVSTYLENLVNPGGVAAAAAEARAANATRTRTSEDWRPLRVPTRNSLMSRSTSMSSGSGTTGDLNRRTPRAQTSFSSTSVASRRAVFEPYNNTSSMRPGDADPSDSEGSFAVPLDLVVVDPSTDPLWNNRSTAQPIMSFMNQDTMNDSFMDAGNVSGSDVDGYDGEPNMYVVDLLSALRGYQSSPTEPFGHLVAAALASRSKEMPVRGFEMAAAEHNPYLVRLILDSGTLDETDVEAQRNVQETMDELFSTKDGTLNPAIYEYLTSFFRMPFARLSHTQYAMLKRSGFEYIKLMYDHQHVLPDEPFHSILINQSNVMRILNLIFMVVQLCTIIFSNVGIALVLAKWVELNGGRLQSYALYTLIVFGGGWALNLICIICTVRSRQDEAQYEPRREDEKYLMVPSPYVAVVPAMPLFDIFCLIAYARALRQKRMILGHNIVACSRLSGIIHAIIFAFPQLITQAYFNNIELSIQLEWRHRWPYVVLLVAAATQWCVALFGYAWLLFTHDSIDGLGFACFNLDRVPHMLERHSAVAHALHYVMASVLETNIFLLVATAIRLSGTTCRYYNSTIIVLSGITVAYILSVYIIIVLTEASTVRISFTCVPLAIIQLVLIICSERVGVEECASLRYLYFRETFIFGYLSWGAYFSLFLVWLILMIQWCVLYKTEVNLFPRLLWPLARKDTRFATSKVDSGDETFPTDSVS